MSMFVEKYVRKGLEEPALGQFRSTDDRQGYAVEAGVDARITAALTAASPIRRLATVVRTGAGGYRNAVLEAPSGDLSEIAPPSGELYANPAASQAMLDDAAFDVEAWLASEIATEFARAEGAAFVGGSGVNQPKGFLSLPATAQGDGTRPFGTLQFVPSGAAGAFVSGAPQDRLIDLVQALRPPYRQGAVFVMNSATASVIRKFKTADGAFLWQPGLVTGQPDTLLGYPLVEAADMPDIAADSLSIAFGNFKAGYLIAERTETQILRDPYTHKPFVHFYATKRVGGQVSNSEAIKLMKFTA